MPGDSTARPRSDEALAGEAIAPTPAQETAGKPSTSRSARLSGTLGRWLLAPDHERERAVGASNWVEAVFEPAALITLVALFVSGIARFGLSVVPEWDVRPIVPVAIFVSLAAVLYTRRLGRSDVRPKEWLAVLLPPLFALRFAPYLLGTGDLIDDVGWWVSDARSFFTASYVAGALLVTLAWVAALMGARDLNGLRLQAGEVARERAARTYRFDDDGWKAVDHAEPMRRLAGRVLWAGALLVFLAALGTIGVEQILSVEALIQIVTFSRPSTSLALANVIVYFAVGLLLIAEGQFVLQQTRWRLEHLAPPTGLASRWLTQSAFGVIAVILLALALPSDYALTVSQMLGLAFEGAMMLINIALGAFMLILAIITSPLRALFPPGEETAPTPQMRPPLVDSAPPGDPIPWLGLAQSLIFWVVALGIVVYCLVIIGRRLPPLGSAGGVLGGLVGVLRAFVAALAMVGRLGRRAASAVAASVTAAIVGRRSVPARPRRLRWVPLSRLSPAEIVEFYYLAVLERAARAGLPRRIGETAAEYGRRLPGQLPEVEPDLSALTTSFEEIRYGRRSVDVDLVAAVKARWQRLKLLFRGRRLGAIPRGTANGDSTDG